MGRSRAQINEGGQTDLLINWTYRKAFNDANQQLGLASAIAVVIFVIVGTISAIVVPSDQEARGDRRMSTATTTAPPGQGGADVVRPLAAPVGWRHLILVIAVLFALFPIVYIINLAFAGGRP